jgi:rod shape-determining protein MreC
VSLRDGPFGDLRVPLSWTAALAAIVAVGGAVAFLVMDHRETGRPGVLDPARRTVDQVLQPVSGALSAPVRWVGDASSFVGSYWDAANENRRLRAELGELRQTRDMVRALRATNERYESLLGLRTEPAIDMVTARSISDAHGPFANTRLVDAGSDRGVAIGNPVINDNGLVGRVVGVGGHVSRVLLLTDVASRTPVMLGRTNARAVLTGDGGPNPRLSYLRTRAPLQPGDVVVTSGDGGVLPRGLTVGVAVRAVDGGWRVALASDAAPVDFVKIMLFRDFSQLLGSGDVRAGAMPPAVTEDPRTRAGTGYTFNGLPQAPRAPATPQAAAPAPAAPASAPAAAAPAPRAAAPAVPAAPPAARPAPAAPAVTAPPTPARPAAAAPRPTAPAPRPAAARPETTARTPAAGAGPAAAADERPSRPTRARAGAAATSSAAGERRARRTEPAAARPASRPRPERRETATQTAPRPSTPAEPPF